MRHSTCICGILSCGGWWILFGYQNARYNHRSFKAIGEPGQDEPHSIQNLQLFSDQCQEGTLHHSSMRHPLKMTN